MNVFKLIEDHGLTLHGDIEHFAELVRADEREVCAKEADKWSKRDDDVGAFIGQAIRARGEKWQQRSKRLEGGVLRHVCTLRLKKLSMTMR